jgi:hypothetical protein
MRLVRELTISRDGTRAAATIRPRDANEEKA